MNKPIIHIMLDLETLSRRSNAAAISLGAIAFDITGVLGDFYAIVDKTTFPESLDVEPATVRWWEEQTDEARFIFDEGQKDSYPHTDVMEAFQDFCKHYIDDGKNEINVWGNGATFDNVIIDHNMEAAEVTLPWSYYQDRDFRTLCMVGEKLGLPEFRKWRKENFVGEQHNAKDDAFNQARYAVEVLKLLEGK